MEQKRLDYIDTAKGILIMFVIFGHIGWHLMDCCNIFNEVLTTFRFLFWHIISPFYMCAFFFIRGYCSRWNKTPKQVFISDLLNIMLPMLVFNIYHDAWFCYAMMFSSLVYITLKRFIDNKVILPISILFVSILGICMHHFGLNWSYISFALPNICFLYIGDNLRKNENIKRVFTYISLLFLPICCYSVFNNIDLPFITGAYYRVSLSTFPFFILLGTMGTLLILKLSEFCKNKTFEYIGKKSLFFYLFHYLFLKIMGRIMVRVPNLDGNVIWIFIYFALFLFVIASTYYTAKLLDRYLPWIFKIHKQSLVPTKN